MAFTVNDYRDLIRLLEEHPDWRVDLRRLLLADDILELPRITRELAEAQQAANLRLDQTFAELTKRLDDLIKRVDDLTAVVTRLATTQEIIAGHVGDLRGWRVEASFRERPYAYFGLKLRKVRVVRPDELSVVEQARDTGQLSDRDWESLLVLDALIQGRVGSGQASRDLFLALEASAIIDRKDVDRAVERADILRKLGLPAIPAVGGEAILPEAEQLARQLNVAVSADGALTHWPEVA
jgi:hypothetical protein